MPNRARRLKEQIMTANKTIFALLTLLGAQATAYGATAAQRQSGHLGWQLTANAEFGGDEVAKVYFTNGYTQSVRAGQGVGLGVGGHYSFADSGFDLSAIIGFKYVTTKASNADIHLNRTVLEFLGTYQFPNNTWISVGPVLHRGINFDAGGLAPNVGFDNASGITFKAGWRWIGVSYTDIKYQDTSVYRDTYNASNVGFFLIGRF
jgi:hypothetical protein